MKTLLILRHIKVENASAVAGMTYGFPAMTNFLGFTHAISRKLQAQHKLPLTGCAVVCHHHQVLAHRGSKFADAAFTQSRNPLLKDGSSRPFVADPKMHLHVSLVLECGFDEDDIDLGSDSLDQDIQQLKTWLLQTAGTLRLAGGIITDIGSVDYLKLTGEERAQRKLLLSLLPGFALTEKTSLLHRHRSTLQTHAPDTELLDAWLDFFSIRHVSHQQQDPQDPDKTNIVWKQVARPAPGWLVPLVLGYKGLSPLYDNGAVADTRDSLTPFRLVEPVYSIGQWLSPHRARHIEQLLWRYQHHGDWYLCKNEINPPS